MANDTHPRVSTPEAEAVAVRDEVKTTARAPRPPPPRWQRWLKKLAIGLAIALVGLYVLYLVVGNVLLKTRVIRNAVSAWPSRSFEYGSAYTLWPGIVHVRDVHLRVRDSEIEFLMVIDEARVDLDLFALTHKVVHARSVQARGVSFRQRFRLDGADVAHRTTYALPPIEGFDQVPLKSNIYFGPTDDAHYDLFTFDFEHVDVTGVRELWVQDYRFAGDAHAQGSFYLRPARKLTVGPASLDIYKGDMHLGPDPVMEGMTGTIHTTIDMFDPRSVTGAEVFDKFTFVDARIDARVPSYAFLEHRYLEGEKPPQLTGGAGSLHLDVRIRKGELESGTDVTLDQKNLGVHLPDSANVATSSQLSFSVKDVDGKPEASMRASLAPVDVRVKGAEKYPLRAPTLGVFARSKNLALRKPFNDLLYSIDVPQLEITDLRFFQHLVGGKIAIGEGAALGKAHLDAQLASESGQGSLSISTHTASARFGDFAVSAMIGLDVKATRLDLSTFNCDLSHSTLDLREVVLTHGSKKEDPWWGKLELDKATLRPALATKLRAEASMVMRDVRPILATYLSTKGLPDWLPKLVTLENFQAHAKVRLGSYLDIDDFASQATNTEVDVRYHEIYTHKHGAIFVKWRDVQTGIEITDDGVKPILIGVREWFDAQK